MKVEQQSRVIESNMMGERVTMGVRSEDMSHIMSVLTDLYKNRLLAVIREYATNAADAHVEAGVSLPIEITLPTVLTPTYKVRDYGTGLDAEGIREVYSQYGRSTKRDTNDQVGMLGLGSKSALTYSDQFTVVSVKDGRRLTVLVSRDEEGAGHMQLLGNPGGDPTDDANGTEIQVAIRREDIERCKTQAEDFFSYWPEGSVLLNGEQPQRFSEHALRITDDLWIVERMREDRVVMGNVSYPHDLDVGGTASRDFKIIAFVPIGSVKPTPSREALMDTALTRDTLTALGKDFTEAVNGAIQREINAAASPQAALQVVIRWARYIPNAAKNAASYSYKGHTLPAMWEPTVHPPGVDRYGMPENGVHVSAWGAGPRSGSVNLRPMIPLADWPKTVWVSDFEPKKFNYTHKAKLLKLCRERNMGQAGEVARFVLCREPAPSNIFIDPAMVLTWESVKAVRLDPPAARLGMSARIAGSFEAETENGYKAETPGSKIRLDKPVFWVHGNRWQRRRLADALPTLYKHYTLVFLPENRINKFKRDVPKAIEVSEGIQAAYDGWVKSIKMDDRRALAMEDAGVKMDYSALDPAKVKDPALRKAIKIAKRDVQKLDAKRDTLRYVAHIGKLGATFDARLEQYPLYNRHALEANAEHVYIYLNAAYAAA